MANRFYALSYGQHEQNIIEGAASTPAADVELRVNVNFPPNTRQDAFKLAEMIANYIISGKTPYPPS